MDFNILIEKENIVKGADGANVPLINITEGGIYDANTNIVTWHLTKPDAMDIWGQVWTDFNAPFIVNGVTFQFNGRLGLRMSVFPGPIMKFVDWDNTVIVEEELFIGTPIVAPADPVREGYVFVKWSPEVLRVMPANSVTFKAEYKLAPTEPEVVKPSVVQPNLGRSCQDDEYPVGYYWDGTACVLPQGYIVPNTGVK